MNRLLSLLIPLAAGMAGAQGQSTGPVSGNQTLEKIQEQDCGCESGALPDVLAIVAGVRITRNEVAEPIREEVQELYRQVIEMRNRELQIQINSRLVEAEANKRGLIVVALLEQEVMAKVKQPTEAEARAYYDQNKARISGEFQDVKATLIDSLAGQRQKEVATGLVERLRAAADVKVQAQKVTPPATQAERARIMATVNGQPITSGDIEDALRPLIFKAQEQLYALRKGVLDPKINGILLTREAQRRKITIDALLAAEVTAKLKEVTEQQAQAFYERNKGGIEGGGDFPQLKERITQYLKDQERRKAEESLAQRLRSAAAVEVFLHAPQAPALDIATNDQPSRGRPDAPVTIVEFTDYQCPSCAQTLPVLEKLAEEYGGRVNLVVRDFPLQQHAEAFKAAEAAEAARAQGKYWEYVRLLYARQSALDVSNLKEYASQLGLDRKEFDRVLESGKYAPQVQRDVQDGRKLGVDSTPVVFVNGRRVVEKTYEALKASIDAALKTAVKTARAKGQR